VVLPQESTITNDGAFRIELLEGGGIQVTDIASFQPYHNKEDIEEHDRVVMENMLMARRKDHPGITIRVIGEEDSKCLDFHYADIIRPLTMKVLLQLAPVELPDRDVRIQRLEANLQEKDGVMKLLAETIEHLTAKVTKLEVTNRTVDLFRHMSVEKRLACKELDLNDTFEAIFYCCCADTNCHYNKNPVSLVKICANKTTVLLDYKYGGPYLRSDITNSALLPPLTVSITPTTSTGAFQWSLTYGTIYCPANHIMEKQVSSTPPPQPSQSTAGKAAIPDEVNDYALEGLSGVFPFLTKLSVSGAKGIKSLDWLAHCTNIEELRVEDCPFLVDIKAVHCLTKLKALSLKGCSAVSMVIDVARIPLLKTLDVRDSGIAKLPTPDQNAMKNRVLEYLH